MPLRVLLVEDNAGDAGLLESMLDGVADADGASAFRLRHVERLAAACHALTREAVDVVLLDLSLPDAKGLDSLGAVRAVAPDVPVVVLTGLADDAVALHAVQAGAQDYLIKGEDSDRVVVRAIRYAVERQRLVRAAQQAARAAQRAARVRDEVLGIVSHDLRNPLTAIGMCARALQDGGSMTPERAASVGETIQRSTEWMRRLIQDLLDVTSIEAGRLALRREPLSAAGVLEDARELYAPLAAEQGMSLDVVADGAAVELVGDPDRLLQVVGNLLGNAIKFTPAGGRITVAVERNSDAVRFTVRDTGPGIAPEDAAHIFDRFWQAQRTRRGGAGLGLAISKGIVEAHGGEIGVESAPDRGSSFWFTLPLGDALASAETAIAEPRGSSDLPATDERTTADVTIR